MFSLQTPEVKVAEDVAEQDQPTERFGFQQPMSVLSAAQCGAEMQVRNNQRVADAFRESLGLPAAMFPARVKINKIRNRRVGPRR